MMSRHMKATEWAKRYFTPESCPDKRTVRSWVRNGHIPGRVIGGGVYVDEAAWLKQSGSGDSLVDKVLS